MVEKRWIFSPRRRYYLLGAAGLIAASGWILSEPLPGATQYVPAGASGAYAQPDTDALRASADDTPVALMVHHAAAPQRAAAVWLDPAPSSAERRLAALVQAPKHGPPL